MGSIFVDLMRKFQKYINWWLMIPSKLYVIINCNSLTIDYMIRYSFNTDETTGYEFLLQKQMQKNSGFQNYKK